MSLLLDRITTDLTVAMKAREELRVSALRMMKTTLMNATIEARGGGKELTDADVIAVLQMHAKRIRESIVEYERGGRVDLAESARRELVCVEAYLPAQVSNDEIRAEIRRVRQETGATAVGPLMGVVMNALKGKADGSTVRTIVEEILAE